jgi:hypothetical protein
MPTFCFTNEELGVTLDVFFHFGKEPKSITREGKKFKRDLAAEWRGQPSQAGEWPILSDAVGVHPDQVKEAEAHARKHGVPTDFTPDGRAVLRDKAHRKAYCELIEHYDRNGGYGDPQQGGRN